MNQSQIDAITQRLDALERQNRLLKCWGTFTATGLLVVILCAAVFPGSVEVVDSNNVTRGAMYVRPNDIRQSGLDLLDANRRVRISMGIDANGTAFLQLWGRDGKLGPNFAAP